MFALLSSERFSNTTPGIEDRSLKQLFNFFSGKCKDPSELLKTPKDFVLESQSSTQASSHQVTWLGHSSFLIELEGLKFLTDPVFSKRCSPVKWVGPKRQTPIPNIKELGKVDFVLISHNHYDHLDKSTVLALHKHLPTITWILPEGLCLWFDKLGIKNTVEIPWWSQWKSARSNQDIEITAVPAQHYSGRGLFDRNKSHWAGFVVEVGIKPKEARFYFAGDTGYNNTDFQAIGKRFGTMDLSLIPIGAYAPRKFLGPVHVDPYQAIKVHQEVGSKLSIGCHWNTFNLSFEDRLRPAYELTEAKKQAELCDSDFLVLQDRQSISWGAQALDRMPLKN